MIQLVTDYDASFLSLSQVNHEQNGFDSVMPVVQVSRGRECIPSSSAVDQSHILLPIIGLHPQNQWRGSTAEVSKYVTTLDNRVGVYPLASLPSGGAIEPFLTKTILLIVCIHVDCKLVSQSA